MTEKRSPTYDLDSIKAAFSTVTKLRATGTAVAGAFALGLTRAEVVAVLQSITRAHLRKSMTSYNDHKVWQDVYDVPFGETRLYVKFTVDATGEFLLVSFKEAGNE